MGSWASVPSPNRGFLWSTLIFGPFLMEIELVLMFTPGRILLNYRTKHLAHTCYPPHMTPAFCGPGPSLCHIWGGGCHIRCPAGNTQAKTFSPRPEYIRGVIKGGGSTKWRNVFSWACASQPESRPGYVDVNVGNLSADFYVASLDRWFVSFVWKSSNATARLMSPFSRRER